MKYELGQIVYYMMDGRPHSAPILSRMKVENAHEDLVHTDAQKGLFTQLGKARVLYATCHGQIEEEYCYTTKEEMISDLCAA
jgi:hypothetical protein